MKHTAWIRLFSRGERLLWLGSVLVIVGAYVLFDRQSPLTLAASLVGVTSLIFCAKGHPFGQVLMILFSLLYGVISYTFAYYGEMITYLGMTMPMAIFSLISWLRHPYHGNRTQVQVNTLRRTEVGVMCLLALLTTTLFYFILAAFHTANLLPSTLSVTTSFVAVYLTFRRSPYYAAAYAANDVVLLILWSMASLHNPRYIAVVACFAAFLINDLYGFINWRRMGARQAQNE